MVLSFAIRTVLIGSRLSGHYQSLHSSSLSALYNNDVSGTSLVTLLVICTPCAQLCIIAHDGGIVKVGRCVDYKAAAVLGPALIRGSDPIGQHAYQCGNTCKFPDVNNLNRDPH